MSRQKGRHRGSFPSLNVRPGRRRTRGTPLPGSFTGWSALPAVLDPVRFRRPCAVAATHPVTPPPAVPPLAVPYDAPTVALPRINSRPYARQETNR